MDSLDCVALMLCILLLLLLLSVAFLLIVSDCVRVTVHSLPAIPVLAWIPVARMLLLNIYHIIMNSSCLNIISDLPEPCIEGVLGVSLQVSIDLDLHRIGNIEHSPGVFYEHLLLSNFVVLDLSLAFPPVRIHYSFGLVLQGI